MKSLGDVITDSLQEFLTALFEPVLDFVGRTGQQLLELIVSTPRPDTIFTQPTNGPWPAIHTYYWETMIPLSLIVWGLSLGLIILLESISHLFSNYHRTKLKKRAFTGLLGILAWWWMAAFSLRFVDSLATFLVPSLSNLSLFETVSIGVMGALGIAVSSAIQLSLFLILALLYILRQILLYMYVLLMPLLIALWVPGVGPFSLVAQLMKRLAGFYVPFLIMIVPVALLFRLGKLLGTSASVSIGGIGQWLMALITPLLAIFVPLILFWQASGIFFIAGQATRHISGQHARDRFKRAKSIGESASNGQKNFTRGLRDEPAVRSDGQMVLDNDSYSHSAGSKLRTAGESLRDRLGTKTGGQEGERGPDPRKRDEVNDRQQHNDSLTPDSDRCQDDASETEQASDDDTQAQSFDELFSLNEHSDDDTQRDTRTTDAPDDDQPE